MPRVLVTANTHPDGVALLRARAGVTVDVVDPSLSGAEQARLLRDGGYHALIAGNAPVTAEAVAGAAALRVVARHGVGYDGIDVAALTRRGIPLFTTGTANSAAVAEHALMMMLALARRLLDWDRRVRTGGYSVRDTCALTSLEGKTVLVVGFGRIGTKVAARCAAFGMRVGVVDPHVPPNTIAGQGYTYHDSVDDALPAADFVTLHLPALPRGAPLLTRERLRRAKPGCIVVNTARGTLVDEVALADALRAGAVGGAGVDVFSVEPPPPDHPLFAPGLNVVASPHAAPNTRETWRAVGLACCRNALRGLDGDAPRDMCVNPAALPRRAAL